MAGHHDPAAEELVARVHRRQAAAVARRQQAANHRRALLVQLGMHRGPVDLRKARVDITAHVEARIAPAHRGASRASSACLRSTPQR